MPGSKLPSVATVTAMLPQILEAAQRIYDDWSQDDAGYDEVFGHGGICQDIAAVVADVLVSAGVDAKTLDTNGMGDPHVWVAGNFAEGIFEIDIHPEVYEVGGGYVWTKIPDVIFAESDVTIFPSYIRPDEFAELE